MTDAFGTRGIADWLGLAAAPAFAVMAVISGVAGDGQPALCTAGDANAALNGMAFMYLLMSVFHLPPWVRALGRAVQRRRSRLPVRAPGHPGGGAPDSRPAPVRRAARAAAAFGRQ